MLGRLHRETELYHGDADTHRLAMIAAGVSPEHYRDLLVRIYGFEAPVEAAFTMVDGLDLVVDLRARGQIKLLRADLLALGILDPTTLPRYPDVTIRDVPEAIGWLYVLERNTQLHDPIERHLRSRLPHTLKVAGSYLAVQERSCGMRWRELGDVLDRVALRPAIADQIGNAAKAAFRCQRSWYELVVPPTLRVA